MVTPNFSRTCSPARGITSRSSASVSCIGTLGSALPGVRFQQSDVPLNLPTPRSADNRIRTENHVVAAEPMQLREQFTRGLLRHLLRRRLRIKVGRGYSRQFGCLKGRPGKKNYGPPNNNLLQRESGALSQKKMPRPKLVQLVA